MCGICGIVDFSGRPVDRERVSAMAAALVHRGPDDSGDYFNSGEPPAGGPQAGLGFRRLSIIDLSGGRQPMRHKQFTIVFNGEIYNYRQLKRECELRGHAFRTGSDTEVILHLYEDFAEECLARLNGMYAFAIWDQRRGEIFLARDRMGIKPLYYFYRAGRFAFASEIKSLLRAGGIAPEYDARALGDFFNHRFVPAPYSILKDVQKVPPGHFLRIRDGRALQRSYWSIPDAPPDEGKSFAQWKAELSAALDAAVRDHMVSDVPVGAFLSGGVDSSLIAALMARHAGGRVRTFCIGFDRASGVDESAHARDVAAFLGTEHRELRLGEDDLLRAEKAFATMTEPVADPTILPAAVLSEFARREVKVALTGEGGDEMFAGYNRYKAALYAQWLERSPAWARPILAPALRAFGRGDCFRALPGVRADNWFALNRDFSDRELESIFEPGRDWTRASYLNPSPFAPRNGGDLLNAILALEARTAMVDRLLMKVDMASMGCSLEARPPYLDPRVVELAFRMPARHKIRRFKGKYVLRSVAAEFLPADIVWRRKHGFIVPVGKWVAAHPADWLRSLLDPQFLDSIPGLSRTAVQNRVEKIYNGRSHEPVALLWPLIVLSIWTRSLRTT